MDLIKLRQKINKLDDSLLELLNERTALIKKVGILKNKKQVNVYNPEREKEILDRLKKESNGLLSESAIDAIFLEIFAVSRNYELPERVAYLGPEGSFTHQAAEDRFGAISNYFPLASIKSVFETVTTGRATYGIVPIENNQQGVVSETVSYLAEFDLKILAEIPMAIHFCFATFAEDITNVKRIYSKDIAFRQCKKFINDSFHDNIPELIPVNSTSKAVNMALEDTESAAISAHIAAKQQRLPILFENIEDSKDNQTRFLILGKDFKNQPSGNDKTTILAKPSDTDKPGSLAEFLQDFHNAGINLTKIESHPAKKGKKFKYWFFIDFDGHFEDEKVKPILKKHEKEISLLGSYVKLC